MFDKRIIPYLDIFKYFLSNVSSIDECLIEFQNTQRYIGELIKLKAEFLEEVNKCKREFDFVFSPIRDEVVYNTKVKSGITFTERAIEDRVIASNRDLYFKMRTAIENSELNYEIVNNLLMAMFQRKDILVEVIKYMKNKHQVDNCLLRNDIFVKKLEKIIDKNE